MKWVKKLIQEKVVDLAMGDHSAYIARRWNSDSMMAQLKNKQTFSFRSSRPDRFVCLLARQGSAAFFLF